MCDVVCIYGMRKQSAIQKKKLRQTQLSRLTRRRMLAIMAEETRADMRQRLRAATVVCLAVDESDGRKIIRARWDTPQVPYRADGVLGVITKKMETPVLASGMQDHAQRTHIQLTQFHRSFFTPDAKLLPKKTARVNRAQGTGQPVASAVPSDSPGRGLATAAGAAKKSKGAEKRVLETDEEALLNYRKKVRVLTSDGGASERRALFLSAASDFFPNASCALKDMMHCIRIATQKPLHLVETYDDVYNELINKRHALLPDIQNSKKWTQLLVAIQQEVIQMPSLSLQGALKVVLRHLAFAKVRMDSCADPLAKVCLMIMPIALLLAHISCDERNAGEQRTRASSLLSKMQPKFMHALGISADWGIICTNMLRLFDSGNHDIADSADELDEFVEIIEAVFVNGGIFQRRSAGGDLEEQADFITERIRKQTRQKCVFRAGHSHTVVWGPMTPTEVQELSLSTRVAAKTMLERVRADMSGVRQDFQCFSLKRIARVFSGDASVSTAVRSKMEASVNNLARIFRIDARMLQLEYMDALPVIHKFTRGSAEAKALRNMDIWGKLLDNRFVESEFPSRVAPFGALVKLIRIWIAILDGESLVERDFSHTRTFVRGCKNISPNMIDDMIVLKLSGPQEPHELAHRSACGDYVGTEFLVRCVKKWLSMYGGRLGVRGRMPRPKSVSKKCKSSFLDARRGVIRAAQRCAKEVNDAHHTLAASTARGVDRKLFTAPPGEKKEHTTVWNPKLARFSVLSKRKRAAGELGRFGRSSFPKFKERNGYGVQCAAPVMRRAAFLPSYSTAACGAVPIEQFEGMGYKACSGRHSCATAHLVVVDSLERFHGSCPSEEWVVHFIYIVGKGLPVTTSSCCWRHGGRLGQLPRSDLVEHVPTLSQSMDFEFSREFRRMHSDAVTAVSHCADQKSSLWRILRSGNSANASAAACGASLAAETSGKKKPKSKLVRIGGLGDLWQMCQVLRRVRNSKEAPFVWRRDRGCM